MSWTGIPITPIRERTSPELWVEKESPEVNSFWTDPEDEEREAQRKMTRTLLKALKISN